MVIQCGQEICQTYAAAIHHEWLETNGLGGFASSTIIGLNTRRYHGLLIAAAKPPATRLVLLAKLEETLILDGQHFELSTNQYPHVIHPQGHRYLKRFRLDPFPVFTYAMEGMEIEKSVFMIQGENSTVIQYELRAGGPESRDRGNRTSQGLLSSTGSMQLEIRPLIAFRDYHGLTKANTTLNRQVALEKSLVSVTPYKGLPTLFFAHNADGLDLEGYWYRNFEYEEERIRGFEYMEDLFNPFVLRFDLRKHNRAIIVASTERKNIFNFDNLQRMEFKRRKTVVDSVPSQEEYLDTLLMSADQYIIKRGEHRTIIAGYPWFTDWGRDTFVSLRGLCLATGRLDDAHQILLAWAGMISDGMLPNRLPDEKDIPEFNSVDASLWYVVAVHDFLQAMKAKKRELSQQTLHTLEEAVEAILAGYSKGTRFRIHLDDDGLLAAGEPGVQLTWMDGKVGHWVVTPRIGKPVEVQALWLNALWIGSSFSTNWQSVFERGREAFRKRFWNEPGRYLYDVVDCDHQAGVVDATFRPNQIFAVGGLPISLLDNDHAYLIVENVQKRLWTPMGLRSLAPEEPDYAPRYEGAVPERDGAYHQGTAWPWLIGPFVEAWVRVRGGTREAKSEARSRFLEPLLAHLNEAGLGHISEIADGAPTHIPRGCPFQAWSLAEVLRLLLVVLDTN